ncbi:uncharacterized protein LOC128670665 [Plodia interpunctella]|uniref:uncharacterized protein LOC128670665 n=1 Tax=Plodia interpunctella TaxID=58824 RepID=UPI002368EFD4|nr:uncharacterized protein LOC128670665 [Plodia interpunctella]
MRESDHFFYVYKRLIVIGAETYYVAVDRYRSAEMDTRVMLLFACIIAASSAWSIPYYHMPQSGPLRVTRYAPPPPHYRIPVRPAPPKTDEPQWERPKRQYDHDHHDHGDHSSGVTGPVHTFVKTDKNANYKWGVRHHVGNKFAS